MIPITLSVIIWRWIFNNQYGIANHLIVGTGITSRLPLARADWIFWTLCMISVWTFFPFVLISILARLQTIPPSCTTRRRWTGRDRPVPPHHAAADSDRAVHRHPAALGLDVQVRHRLDVGRTVVRRPGRARPDPADVHVPPIFGLFQAGRARRWRTSCSSCCCSRRTSTSATSSTTRRRYDRAGGDAGSAGRAAPGGARARSPTRR